MNTKNQPNIDVQPTAPMPQTVSGILTTHGETYTDLNCDYGDEFDANKILGNWHLTHKQTVGINDTEVIKLTRIPTTQYPKKDFWHAILAMSSFITCTIWLKFLIIKPLVTSGKMLLQYTSNPAGTFDDKLRNFKVEWDMSKSNSLVIQATGHQLGKYRICTGGHGFSSQGGADIGVLGYSPKEEFYQFGAMKMDMIASIQPGSIYPDQYTLLRFISFRDVVIAVPRTYLADESNHLVKSE